MVGIAVWEGRAVTGALDGAVRFWNIGTGECEACREGHGGMVLSLASEGGLVAVGRRRCKLVPGA